MSEPKSNANTPVWGPFTIDDIATRFCFNILALSIIFLALSTGSGGTFIFMSLAVVLNTLAAYSRYSAWKKDQQ